MYKGTNYTILPLHTLFLNDFTTLLLFIILWNSRDFYTRLEASVVYIPVYIYSYNA
jgi:hypothetical protein